MQQSNPLLDAFVADLRQLSRLHPTFPLHDLFSPSTDPSTRGEVWESLSSKGEGLINAYSWAIPNETALRVVQHFASLDGGAGVVEVGCGANYYWGKRLIERGVDYRGYDIDVDRGGKLEAGGKKAKKEAWPKKGGAEVLAHKDNCKRALFLCFPDEDVQGNNEHAADPLSVQCLSAFTGDHIIHVGELFGANVSRSQSPFGRSTSAAFQCRLHAEFHCLLRHKVSLVP